MKTTIICTWTIWGHHVNFMSYRAKKIDEEQRYFRNKRLSELEEQLTQIGLKMLSSVDKKTYFILLDKFKEVSRELNLYDDQ